MVLLFSTNRCDGLMLCIGCISDAYSVARVNIVLSYAIDNDSVMVLYLHLFGCRSDNTKCGV